MYRILYNDRTIFDPYGDDDEVVYDASMSVEINAAAYLDFTMSRRHPLYDTIAERDGVVTLYWDQKILFQGTIESIDIDIEGNKSVSCVSAMDYLNDTIVRPYSTIAGEQDLTAPSSVDGYFQWLIDQHNEHVLDSQKLFSVGINQGANLQQNNFIYRSSTSNPTTASEITDQLLDALGGYLTMRYADGAKILDLYADIHTMNAQIIDFGVNITDFNKTIDTADQYTALLLKGGAPEFLGGDFETGDFQYWEVHPNTSISTSQTHGGLYSSFFTEGNGEYVPTSFFYGKKGARYKATVYVKNERSSGIHIFPRYQTNVSGEWIGQTVDGNYEIPNDGEWHEYSFEFAPNIENNVKIRPRWVFDTVGNDGGKRVYVDDFSFSRVEGDSDIGEDPIDVSIIPDGGTKYSSTIVKHGDVIYDPDAVSRYGYKEKVFEDSTITNVDDLLEAGIKELNKVKEPQIGLDIKAVDLALYMDGYDHLNVGDAVRVRSAIHDTDEFLMVSSITLDLEDPDQSEYNIGKAYDSLTGQQSGFLRSLNSGINSSLDAVASLDQTTKDQAIQIGNAQQTADNAQQSADNAQQSANNAQQTANTAQQTANSNKEQINTIKDKQSEQDELIEKLQQGITDSEADISGINDRLTQMDSDIEQAQSDIDAARQEAQTNFETAKAAADAAQTKADSVGSDLESFRTETNQTVQNVKDSVSDVQSDVDTVTQKASDLASDLDATKATVEQTVSEFGEVKTTATNAASKADQSLQVSTQASQTATAASQKATSAYEDAQTAINQSSEAVQTANEVSLSLKTDYQTKADADAKYATQASLTATSDQIKTEVSKTYATKATVDALENIANNAVQTWMGDGVPTLSNKPASDWNTAELKAQHSGDIYYDTDTGYSYRFGSSDGSTYSWALIKDTDISKALADAAKAQETADNAESGVTELQTSIPVTYATKTELTQKADSITSRVEEVAQAGTATSTKVTQLEQKTDEIKSTVAEQGSTLDGAVQTISQVSQKADSLSSKIEQTNSDISDTLGNSYNLIPNGTPSGDYKKPYWLTVVDGVYQTVRPGNEDHVDLGFQKLNRTLLSDRTYTMSFECRLVSGTITSDDHFKFGVDDVRWQGPNVKPTNEWTRFEYTLKNPSGGNRDSWFMSSYLKSEGSKTLQFRNISIVDSTDVQTANDTANSALSKASTVEQTLDSFKTTVAQTYETKNDALSKQSALTQTINGFKTEVSETYTTKDEFNALEIGGTNLIQNSDFSNGTKQWTADAGTITSQTDPTYGYALYANLNSSNRRIYNVTKNVWIKGEPVAYSFYARTDDENPRRIRASRSMADYDEYFTLSSSWQRLQGVIIPTQTPNDGTGTLSINIDGNGTFQLARVKLEKGNKATAWSPAPEDLDVKYTSKTEFQQTTDKISATATAASQNASSALSKISSLEVSVNGIETKVEENALAIGQNTKTISQVSQKADSISSTVQQVTNDIDRLDANSQNYITNPQFKSGNADHVQNTAMEASDSGAGKLPGTATTYGKSIGGYDNWCGNVRIKGIPGHTYRIEIDAKRASDNTDASSGGVGLFFWYFTEDNPGLSSNGYTTYNAELIPASVTDWTHGTYDYVFPSNSNIKVIRPAYRTPPSKHWLVTNFTCTDITAIKDAKDTANTANSTANSALSKASTVEQSLNGFKTTVSQTYETKSDASSKQSSLQQSVNNLRTEVSETYTTKTEFDDLEIGGTNLFVIGTSKDGVRVSSDGGEYYDSGYTMSDYISVQPNKKYILTAYMDGSGNTSDDYVAIARYRSDKSAIDRPIMDMNSFKYGDSWSITATSETAYVRLSFPSSGKDKFKFEQGSKSTDYSPSPEDMLSKDEAETTYSTKSYVDQTSRTVSLGVVEEYKSGQHGSALATASDITAAKDSITSTVSQTYATKNDVGVGNLIKNGDFSDGTSNWTTNGGTSKIVDGTYGKQFVFTQTGTNTNGNNRIYNPSYNHINGQAYEVSFYAKADKSSKWHFGPTGSSKAASATLDTTLKQYTIQYQADGTTVLSIWTDNPTATIYLERVKLSIASGYYATKTEVTQTSDALTVKINSAASAASTAQSTADTAKANAATAQSTANTAKTNAATAQSTADKANTNATNANNRVGNLETCIKMTTDGVRVGKLSNGEFTGYSALVNSSGSFDILDGSSNAIAKFSERGLNVKTASTRSMFMGTDSNGNGYIGSTPTLDGATAGQGFDIGMAMGFKQGDYLNIINNLGGVGISGNGISLASTGSKHVQIDAHDVRGTGIVLFDRDDNVSYGTVNIALGYNFSDFNWILCGFKTNDNTYFCQAAYHPNGKYVLFGQMGVGNNTDTWLNNLTAYYKVALWKFDGTQAIRQTTKEIALANQTPAVTVNDNVLRLVSIVGFDYYKTAG